MEPPPPIGTAPRPEAKESNRSGNNDGDEPHRGSPESAGLARGLARSAARKGASRAAVGRLPLRPPSAAGRASTANVAKSAARIRRLARVSDRAATGFDVVAEAHSAAGGTPVGSRGAPAQPGWKARAWAFGAGLTKSTILGAAVFATYEGMVDYRPSGDTEGGSDPGSVGDNICSAAEENSSSLLWHYGSGFCAGSVHAFLGRAIEGLASFSSAAMARNSRTTAAAATSAPSPAFMPYLLHHGASHTVLFGSYETIKRLGLGLAPEESEHETEDNPGLLDRKLATVAIAGGIAGIGQQLAADWTERVIEVVGREKATGGATGILPHGKDLWSAATKLPSYSARTLWMVSLPTSIGFVAFEYGREAVSGDA